MVAPILLCYAPLLLSQTLSFTEYPVTAGGYPNDITIRPNGELWFAYTNAMQVGRITTTGSASVVPVPAAVSTIGAIATGPDGALWLTDDPDNSIQRIATSGAVTTYALPTGTNALSGPLGIAAGPDVRSGLRRAMAAISS